MIPKIIHYCWFGGNLLPKSAIKCINSWVKFFPDYKIIQWSERNIPLQKMDKNHKSFYAKNGIEICEFDVNIIPYTKEAHDARKYAFVSDYVRFWVLYNHGGLYFDTDVKIIRSMDDIVNVGPFMGREAGAWMTKYGKPNGLSVAPGLGLGAKVGMSLYKEFLDVYKELSFINKDGTFNTKTIVNYTSEILLKHGLTDHNDKIEQVGDVWVYPVEYFCPMDHTRGCIVNITDNTRSIHFYNATWEDKTLRYRIYLLKNWIMRTFGYRQIKIRFKK